LEVDVDESSFFQAAFFFRGAGILSSWCDQIDPNCDYGSLASLVSRAAKAIDAEQIAEQWDCMGQLYASLRDRPRHGISGPETTGRLQRKTG
jgi:hypothetical protein